MPRVADLTWFKLAMVSGMGDASIGVSNVAVASHAMFKVL